MTEKLYTVGMIANTHGIRGELKVVSHTDFPEERFAPKSSLYIQHPNNEQTISVTVERSRLHKNVYMVKFVGLDDINDVEKYKGWFLKISDVDRDQLEEDEYYYSDIIGCQVVTDEGEELGVIKEILAPGANHVWVVKRPKGQDVLLPVIDDVILKVDVASKLVTVHLMEGLI
ncbi:ribosome maturation factor RimM [Paenibacillus marinisediminis]